MTDLFTWIEIPASNMARAKAFYEGLFGSELVQFPFGTLTYAMFPSDNFGVHGALVSGEGYTPSADGPLVYLNGAGRLDVLEQRIAPLGGQVLMPKTFLSDEAGEVVIFLDSEGNRLGLQAPTIRQSSGPVADVVMKSLLDGATPNHAFLITRGQGYDDPATLPLQWEHARNMFTLMRDGRLSHVSALVDGSDVLGFGLLAVASRAEAEAILAKDPGIAGGRLGYQMLTAVSFDGERTRPKL